MDFLEILQNPEWQKTIVKYAREKTDPLLLAKQLGTDVPVELRQLISVHAGLVMRKKQKFGVDDFLLCDRLALEQASARDVSQWKAGILPEQCIVFDLCCGMGGDSFFLGNQQLSVGIDLDPQRIQMFSYNLGLLGRPHLEFCADVTQLRENWSTFLPHFTDSEPFREIFGDSISLEPGSCLESGSRLEPGHCLEPGNCYFLLDPARRASDPKSQRSEVSWKISDLQPGPEHWQNIVSLFAGGIIKLPPGMDFSPDFPCEQHFLGSPTDCREQVLLCGELCQNPARTGFTDLVSGRSWFATTAVENEETATQRPGSQAPGSWLTEPWPPAIRSHIFPELARKYGLWQMDEQIAWLSSEDKPPEDFPGTSWEILDSCSMRDKEIKRMLRGYEYGTIVVKKRGVQMDPAQESRRWSKKKGPQLTMIYTRVSNKPIVFLVRRA